MSNAQGLQNDKNIILAEVTARLSQNHKVMNYLSMIGLFDRMTYHHSVNVAAYAVNLGASIGLETELLVELGIGALLHDFGKIYIDNKIINKPGQLSPQEFELIKKHPVSGCESLLSSQNLSAISADIILHHHERYDGGGYPHSLRGVEISVYSRIITICDVFDALTSDRPYRTALPIDTALEYLKDNAGTLFDPELVDAFSESIKYRADLPLAAR